MNDIKVGICVAYDWYFLEKSLPLIYDNADIICLSLDVNRISWNNNPFPFEEEAFKILISNIDTKNKIEVYEDNFHLPDLSPMENEVRQRNLMAHYLKDGGWHIQIDSDEYFVDFSRFVNYLKSLKSSYYNDKNILCPVVNLYKYTTKGVLYIDYKSESQYVYHTIATKAPSYEYGRLNGRFNIYTNHLILHESWSRSETEIRDKIKNWGHANDFDTDTYFRFWKELNENNYKDFNDFHPVKPNEWPSLSYISVRSINQLLTYVKQTKPFHVSPRKLRRKNSLMISRLKKLFSILGVKTEK